MSLLAAVDRINTWAVTGVTTNYGLDDLPGILPESALPALVLMGGDDGKAQPFDLALSKAVFNVTLLHALVLRGAGLGNPKTAYYGLIPLIDNYFAKVKTDWTLNGNLLEPLKITRTVFKPVIFGTVPYWAVLFTHEWRLTI